MAVVEEFFDINGTSHVRHYSNSGLMIASDETETPIPSDGSEAEEILNILTGGE